MYLFTGHRDHRIDGKDRIVVPSSYAADIQTHGEGTLFLVPGADGPYLEAYPADVFRQMALGQVPSRFEGDQTKRRAFFQTAEKADLNGPGRITLPKRFLPLFPAGVVRVCGMNTYLELWDPAHWERSVGGVTANGAAKASDGGKPPSRG
jgi:DNA-binding transcriptional regulator/RsmH inhibitor MraZ